MTADRTFSSFLIRVDVKKRSRVVGRRMGFLKLKRALSRSVRSDSCEDLCESVVVDHSLYPLLVIQILPACVAVVRFLLCTCQTGMQLCFQRPLRGTIVICFSLSRRCLVPLCRLRHHSSNNNSKATRPPHPGCRRRLGISTILLVRRTEACERIRWSRNTAGRGRCWFDLPFTSPHFLGAGNNARP